MGDCLHLIPLQTGFLYLKVINDIHSRHVLSWKLTGSLEMALCLKTLVMGLSGSRVVYESELNTFGALPLASLVRCLMMFYAITRILIIASAMVLATAVVLRRSTTPSTVLTNHSSPDPWAVVSSL
jgi:hypothetical protein